MTRYFEFKDDKSSKFWEITLDGNTVKTRYGKIGTDGQTTEKQFDSTEKAQKEYEKLVKEKTGKGYTEGQRSGDAQTSGGAGKAKAPQFKNLSWEEFAEQFEPVFEMPFEDFAEDTPVRLYTGDESGNVCFPGDYELNDSEHEYNVVVDGNLIVEGNLGVYAEGSGNFMLVMGNLKAQSVLVNGCATLEVRGETEAQNGIVTMYGDDGGYLTLHGEITAPFLLNGFYFNLDMFGAVNAVTIDYSSNGMDSPDFERKTIAEALVPELMKDEDSIDTGKLFRYLREGKQILQTHLLKKQPVQNPATVSPQFITLQEANERFGVNGYLGELIRTGLTRYLLYENGFHHTGLLDVYDFPDAPETGLGDFGVIVLGDMVVEGVLFEPETDFGLALLVTGNLTVQSINKGGGEFYIKGNLTAGQILAGGGNHGKLTVEGNTVAQVIYSDDHHMVFKGDVQSIVVLNYGKLEGVAADYDQDQLTDVLLPELLTPEGEAKNGEILNYINEGRHIVRKELLPQSKIVSSESSKPASPKPQLITEKEAKERFGFSKYINGLYGDKCLYLFYEGDVFFDSDVNTDELCHQKDEQYGIIVAGNLTVNGVLYQPGMDNGETLFVTGNLKAKAINKGGAEFYIKGNAEVEQIIYGYYNHGMLTVEGNTEAAVIFAEDHSFVFKGDVSGLVINTGSITGVESDFQTTEPLLPELVQNAHYSHSDLVNDYINAGKPIVRKEFLPEPKIVSSETSKPASPTPKFLTKQEADEAIVRFQLKNFGLATNRILFLDGDTYIEGDLTIDWVEQIMTQLGYEFESIDLLLLINGNLTVSDTVEVGYDGYPNLLVVGGLSCQVLHSYDESIYITGDADINYVFNGNYNDGSIIVKGTTRVPFVLNSDHSSGITPEGAVLINYYSDYNDFFEYDYTVRDLERVLVKEVMNGEDLDVQKFIERLKAGKAVLKKGAKPARMIFEEELEKLAAGNPENLTELDLSDKKFKEFPKAVAKLKNLKKLTLNSNSIPEIPDAISRLANLEELYLEKCGLSQISDKIGNLQRLRVLDVSNNAGLQLPDALGKLASLKTLKINYNDGFGVPETIAQLTGLEALEAYQCTDATPVDFPEWLTKLTGLKHLNVGSNSFKSIPDGFLNLTQLESLNLNASLCYLNTLPDLSQFKNLKILRADGLISYTTRPNPKQTLLQHFFAIGSLEELYIDRHGKDKRVYKNKDFEEMLQNLAHDPKRQAEVKALFSAQKEINPFYGTIWEGIPRPALTAAHLQGIGKLQNLTFLDLSFNGLTDLPDELLALKNLRFVNLKYNQLGFAVRQKLYKSLPHTQMDFSNNDIAEEQTAENAEWQAMTQRIKEANALMNAKNDADKLRQSLQMYDEVLDYFRSGKVVDEYNLLYANYGKVWAYSYLNSYHKATFTPEALWQSQKDAIAQGLQTLALIPAMIWHYTDLGRFHEEVSRITANSVAWQMMETAQDKADLDKALEVIQKGVRFAESESQWFILDTQVRILLKLGRTEEAYRIVQRVLVQSPGFGDFQDFKQNKNYQNWLKKQG